MRVSFAVCAAALALCPLEAQTAADSGADADRIRKAALLEVRFRQKQALDRAYALGKRFQTFDNRLVASRAMAVLGQTVCRYDHAYAETLFTDAVHNLAIVPHVSAHDVAHARRQVLADTATCDPVLALRLSPWRRGDDKTPRVALSMLQAGDLADATEAASGVLFATLSAAGTQSFVQFLLELQNQGEAQAADDLFIGRIAWISSQTVPGTFFDAQSYSDLGAYLFDSNPIRPLSASGPEAQIVQPQADIGEDAVRAYLETAPGLLAIRENRREVLQVRYELALALLPQVRTLEPDLEPQYTAVLKQLGSALGADPRRDERQLLGSPSAASKEDEQVRQAGTPVSEDTLRVGLILKHWSPYDTKRMRELATGIHNPAVAQKLDALITYAEAVTDPQSRNRLQPSTKSTLLWLARDDISLAVHDVPYADPDLRPLLLLAAARSTIETHLATADKTAYAYRLLAEAVAAYNAADTEDPPGNEEISGWDEVVEVGDTVYYFPLRSIVDVRDINMSAALSSLAARDPERVETALRELRNEHIQAESLTYVMAMRLAAAFAH